MNVVLSNFWNYDLLKLAEMSMGIKPGKILCPMSSGVSAEASKSYRVSKCMFTSVSLLFSHSFSKVVRTLSLRKFSNLGIQ